MYFSPYLGVWGGGGGSLGGWGKTCLYCIPAWAAQEWKFQNLIFLSLIPLPSSSGLAEGNRIAFYAISPYDYDGALVVGTSLM